MNIERRSFLRGAALFGGAAALAGITGCSSPSGQAANASEESAGSVDWSKEADVVVVGAGGGGLAAAVEAVRAGQEVIVVEAMSNTAMSNTALCAGMIQGAVTSVQKEAGIEDSVDEFDKFLEAIAEGFEDTELRRLYAEKSGETIDWLIEQGVELPVEGLKDQGTAAPYYADVTPVVPRVHTTADGRGASYTEPLTKIAEDEGAQFLFNTQGSRLVTNAQGEVIGVTVKSGSSEENIKARKGVVLATAGFSRNPEMIRDYMTLAIPKMANDVPVLASYGSPMQKGDGIRMGQAIGAKISIPWTAYQFAAGIAGNPEDNSGGFGNPGVYVRTDGTKYDGLTDCTSEEKIGDIWRQPGGFVWSIWDQAKVDSSIEKGSFALGMSADLTVEVESGAVRKADSLAELAEMINVDAAVLEDTLATYNASIDAESGKLPVETAPFYAGRSVAVSPDTSGGLAINTDTQVKNVFGEVIPRLYAVGNNAGGFKGKICAGCGQALGWTFTSGRIAGQHVSTLENWS